MRYAAPLIIFLIVMQSFVANADESLPLSGYMKCKVADYNVVQFESGTFSKLDSEDNYFQKGDTVSFNYFLDRKSSKLRVGLEESFRRLYLNFGSELSAVGTLFSSLRGKVGGPFNKGPFLTTKDLEEPLLLIHNNYKGDRFESDQNYLSDAEYKYAVLSYDSMFISMDHIQTLNFKRVGEKDWVGSIYIGSPSIYHTEPLTSTNIHMNCRDGGDAYSGKMWDQFIDALDGMQKAF